MSDWARMTRKRSSGTVTEPGPPGAPLTPEPALGVSTARVAAGSESSTDAPRRTRAWSSMVGAVVLAGLCIYLVGSQLSDSDIFPAMISAGIWANAAIGLGLLVGRAGQVSLGQGAVAAVAAYGAGYAISVWGLPFPVTFLFAVAMAVAFALVSSPILRVRGFYFALATLAAAIVVERLIVAWKGLTGGPNGLGGIERLTIFGYEFRSEQSFFFLSWSTVVVGAVVLRLLVDSRFGRGLTALSHDEEMAATSGIPVGRYKAWVWVISAMYAAVAATLFTYYNRFLTAEQFDLHRSIELIAAVIAGGAATVVGPVVGLLGILVLPQVLHIGEGQTEFIVGGLLVFTALFAPHGLVPAGADLARRAHRRITGRPERAESEDLAPQREVSAGDAGRRTDLQGVAGIVDAGAQVDQGRADELTLAGPSSASGGPSRPLAVDEIALGIVGLRMRFGGLVVLSGVDLDVASGSIQGIIGPNGAGKTSLINCVTGLLHAETGKVTLAGRDVTGESADALCRDGLVRTFQHTRLLADESALDNVLLGTHTRGSRSAIAAILRLPGFRREERDLRAEALERLEDLGCVHLAGTPARNLTAGQQRLVAIAKALAAKPKVLLLDEPAAGLNETEVSQLADDLRRVRESGTTIVIVEHHLDLIMSLCDRVAVLNNGVIIANDVPSVIREDPDVIEAYLGADT